MTLITQIVARENVELARAKVVVTNHQQEDIK
jgi:hypothetical protein